MELIDAVVPRAGRPAAGGHAAENYWWNLLSYVYARRPALARWAAAACRPAPTTTSCGRCATSRSSRGSTTRRTSCSRTPTRSRQPAGETIRGPALRAAPAPAPGVVSPIQITGSLPPDRKEARKAGIGWLLRPTGRTPDTSTPATASPAGRPTRLRPPRRPHRLARRSRRICSPRSTPRALDVRLPRELAPALVRLRRRRGGAHPPRHARLPRRRRPRRPAPAPAPLRAPVVGPRRLARVAGAAAARVARAPPPRALPAPAAALPEARIASTSGARLRCLVYILRRRAASPHYMVRARPGPDGPTQPRWFGRPRPWLSSRCGAAVEPRQWLAVSSPSASQLADPPA